MSDQGAFSKCAKSQSVLRVLEGQRITTHFITATSYSEMRSKKDLAQSIPMVFQHLFFGGFTTCPKYMRQQYPNVRVGLGGGERDIEIKKTRGCRGGRGVLQASNTHSVYPSQYQVHRHAVDVSDVRVWAGQVLSDQRRRIFHTFRLHLRDQLNCCSINDNTNVQLARCRTDAEVCITK